MNNPSGCVSADGKEVCFFIQVIVASYGGVGVVLPIAIGSCASIVRRFIANDQLIDNEAAPSAQGKKSQTLLGQDHQIAFQALRYMWGKGYPLPDL
jgi:hypothetical protein